MTRRPWLRLTLLVVGFFAMFTTAFAMAAALGLEDEAWWAELLSGQTGLVAAGLLLVALVSDLVLPIPSSVVMSASGALFGPLVGSVLNICGSFASAMLGYGLCRRFGRRAFRRLIGRDEAPRIEAFVARYGAWAIVCSRAVPMLTETVSCVAGLAGMGAWRFAVLTMVGAVPVGVVYAVMGAELGARTGFGAALAIALVLPPLLLAGWTVLRALAQQFEMRQEERG